MINILYDVSMFVCVMKLYYFVCGGFVSESVCVCVCVCVCVGLCSDEIQEMVKGCALKLKIPKTPLRH